MTFNGYVSSISYRFYIVLFILFILYIFMYIFPTIHYLCMFGGGVNILIHFHHINWRPKRKIQLKNEDGSPQDPVYLEPTISVQFINLCRGFKYGATGYVLTLAIPPYALYKIAYPERGLIEFKQNVKNTCTDLFFKLATEKHLQ